MANEITLNLGLSVSNGTFKDSIPQQSVQYTQNAVGSAGGTVSVTTAGAILFASSVTTYGLLWLFNLDATNYVDYGVDNAGSLTPFGRLKAGESALVRLKPGISFRAQANTATVQVQYLLLND